MDRSSWGFGTKSRLEASGARYGAAKSPVGPKPPRGGARLGMAPSSMCGEAFLAAISSRPRRRVPARRPRQARPARPDRPVFGSSPCIIYRATTSDGLRVGRFALGGGRRGGPCVHRGACFAGISQLRWFLRPRGVAWVCLASNGLRYTTFFGGDGRHTVGFFNPWLAFELNRQCSLPR